MLQAHNPFSGVINASGDESFSDDSQPGIGNNNSPRPVNLDAQPANADEKKVMGPEDNVYIKTHFLICVYSLHANKKPLLASTLTTPHPLLKTRTQPHCQSKANESQRAVSDRNSDSLLSNA